MPKSYRHISNYEKEILELKAQGLTRKEIEAKLGFTKEQVHYWHCWAIKKYKSGTYNSPQIP